MTRHELKCWPGPFDEVVRDRKHHEIRVDDRPEGYTVHDELLLREWVPPDRRGLQVAVDREGYTGRRQLVAVTSISRGPDWGLPVGLVVMSIERRSLRDL